MTKLIDLITRDLDRDRQIKAAKLGITLEQLKVIEDAEQATQQAEAAIRNADYQRDWERRQAEAQAACKALGEKLGLRVPVSPAEVVMLRYLTERGMGTGTNNKTVIHIRVLEAFDSGRIHRKKNDLLCGRKGKFDIHNVAVQQELTCPRCLEIAARHVARQQ